MKKKILLLICLITLIGCAEKGNECYSSNQCLELADGTISAIKANYYTRRAIVYAIKETK